MSYLAAGVAGVLFFIMSTGALGVWPHRVLASQTAAMSPPEPLGLSAAEERGRRIYAREGCAYCHTQQIRYTEADIERFGAPTLAWETRFDTPHLWGTRRIGPDLARAGGTRTENWQLVHLYAPRAVAPLSIMPSYAALFDGSPDRPTQEARDLVAYIETLGRARALIWPEGDAAARAAAPDDHWARMAFDAPALNAHPGRTQPRGDAPALGNATSGVDGSVLWDGYCAGCHGETGRGDGPAAEWLSPRPTNLTEHAYTRSRLADVLWNGVDGSSMPGWRDHSAASRAALADVVAGFSALEPGPTPSAQQLARGQGLYTQHCATCHGTSGDGDGFAANNLPIPIVPTDFRNQRIGYAAGLRVLENGIEGSSMAPWTDRLTDAEIEAVVHYVRSLFDGDEG
jgi:cbb3-type cytochrome oxidase cytochrome c subunit